MLGIFKEYQGAQNKQVKDFGDKDREVAGEPDSILRFRSRKDFIWSKGSHWRIYGEDNSGCQMVDCRWEQEDYSGGFCHLPS